MKKYLIFDLDGTLIESMGTIVQVIVKELEKIPWVDIEKARYIFHSTGGTSLKEQLQMICQDESIDYDSLTEKLYDKISKVEAVFFPQIPEKIKKLQEKYTLFLSTWNSTPTAERYLQEWWMYSYFKIILWSNEIPKWARHLEIFQQDSQDIDFYKKAIYIWDWDSDRIFAWEKWIDFIHIGNDKKDIYEIQSVAQIDTILELLN